MFSKLPVKTSESKPPLEAAQGGRGRLIEVQFIVNDRENGGTLRSSSEQSNDFHKSQYTGKIYRLYPAAAPHSPP